MDHPGCWKVLGICGSLRSASSNKAVLHALMKVQPRTLSISLFEQLHLVQPFNPDEEFSESQPVSALRSSVQQADAVLFSTPEYAHGVPGSLKNALDWLVGSGEFSKKPVALINASPRGVFA